MTATAFISSRSATVRHNYAASARKVEDAAVTSGNPIQVYLARLRHTELLNAEQEVAVARKMDEGRASLFRTLFSSPAGLRALLDVQKDVERGTVRAKYYLPEEDLPRDLNADTCAERLSHRLERVRAVMHELCSEPTNRALQDKACAVVQDHALDPSIPLELAREIIEAQKVVEAAQQRIRRCEQEVDCDERTIAQHLENPRSACDENFDQARFIEFRNRFRSSVRTRDRVLKHYAVTHQELQRLTEQLTADIDTIVEARKDMICANRSEERRVGQECRGRGGHGQGQVKEVRGWVEK